MPQLQHDHAARDSVSELWGVVSLMKLDKSLSHQCERCPRRIAWGRKLCIKCEFEAAKARKKLLGGK